MQTTFTRNTQTKMSDAKQRQNSAGNSGRVTNKEKLTHMPNCRDWIAETRKVFGDPVAIVARENNLTVEWRK